MRRRQTQTGFTIIELVVVILLLGILTATALPRFIDVTDDAHAAVVDAVEGGLATGMAMAHAQWFADNRPVSLPSTFAPGGLGMSANGWPTDVPNGAAVDSTDCDNVFTGVLQGGRPTTTTAGDVTTQTLVFGSDPFQVGYSAGTCVYVYVAQGAAFSAPVINYDPTTGEVSRGTSLPN